MKLSYILMLACFSCSQPKRKQVAAPPVVNQSGVTYHIIPSEKTGDPIRWGDVVKMDFQQYIDDSLLMDTRQSMPAYVTVDSTLKEFEFTEILTKMRMTDSAVYILPARDIIQRGEMGKYPPNVLQNGKDVRIFIKILAAFQTDSLARLDNTKEMKAYRSIVAQRDKAGFDSAQDKLEKFLKLIVKPRSKLPNGIYVSVTQEGKGNKIKKNDSVAVIYKGILLNGSVFQTTTRENPYIFKVGDKNAIEGLDSGIEYLHFGDRAIIYIPAKSGYGSNPGKNIPSYSNLIYEVFVFDARKNK